MNPLEPQANSAEPQHLEAPYEAPQVELVLTPEEVSREIQFAGVPSIPH